MVDKAVHHPADLAGLKLRVPGPTGIAVVEALGATPVTMPVPDLPQALTTHAVDGALIPWEIIPALKLQDSTQYQIEGPNNQRFGTTTFQVTMNKDTWEIAARRSEGGRQQAFRRGVAEDGRRRLARQRRCRHQGRDRRRQRAHRAHRRGDGGVQHRARAGDRPLGEGADRRRASTRRALVDAAKAAIAKHSSALNARRASTTGDGRGARPPSPEDASAAPPGVSGRAREPHQILGARRRRRPLVSRRADGGERHPRTSSPTGPFPATTSSPSTSSPSPSSPSSPTAS